MNLVRLFRQRYARRDVDYPAPQPLDNTPIGHARLVVLDLETSGLNLQRDEILSIGAVGITQGVLHMSDQFERTVFRPNHQPGEATVLHEITPSHVLAGQPIDQVLQDFLSFAGPCVLFAFHAGFDQRMLARSLNRELDYRLRHRFVDVAEMAPMLFPAAAAQCSTLDSWQDYFQLTNSERHNAAADAQATAEMLLILLSRLAKQGVNTLAELDSRLSIWRQLHQARSIRL